MSNKEYTALDDFKYDDNGMLGDLESICRDATFLSTYICDSMYSRNILFVINNSEQILLLITNFLNHKFNIFSVLAFSVLNQWLSRF